MTATVTALPAALTTGARSDLLAALAREVTCGYEWVSPERVADELGHHAHPSLTGSERQEAWDDTCFWTETHEDVLERRGHPANVDDSCTGPWAWEMAGEIAAERRASALARLVNGNATAVRGHGANNGGIA